MGTRADFYVLPKGEKELKQGDWIASIAWDGYPEGIPFKVINAKTRGIFEDELIKFFVGRDDVTTPSQGWPWPWDNSETTDYSYVLDENEGEVVVCSWGENYKFPDMKSIQEVDLGKRSGVTIVRVGGKS